MFIIKIYFLIGAAATVTANLFFPFFRESYAWWLIPTIVLGTVAALILLQLLTLVIMIITADLEKTDGKDNKFFRILVKHSVPIVVFLARVKINAHGLEKLPEDNQKMLFLCNHQHDFDPVILYHCFPDASLSFIGKKDILSDKKFFAKAMIRLSCLFIDRENDREAAKTIITAIKYLKDKRCSIGLFPEGYCSKDDEILPLRNGSLKIALKAKVPVAVCVINNTKKLPKNIFRRKTQIDFSLLEIIEPEFYENMNTAELGEIIHQKLVDGLKELKRENSDDIK